MVIINHLRQYLDQFTLFFNTSKQITDRYQVLGRNVHMDYVQEHLRTKREVTFGETQERANGIELEILTDTVYVKVGIFTVNFGKGKFFFSVIPIRLFPRTFRTHSIRNQGGRFVSSLFQFVSVQHSVAIKT